MRGDPMSNAFADKDNYQCNREMFSYLGQCADLPVPGEHAGQRGKQ